MRNIRFRAWDYPSNKMYNVENICFNGRKTATLQYAPLIKKNIEDVEIMQYTGLKDKNGVEIYEGDIVINLGQDCGTDGIFYNDTREVISWDEKACGFKPFTYPADWLLDKCEVIGNIYENPELLEATK